ncbi:PREDICTED: protein NETWORKED 4B [Tarenaya hassleriana]|uniref:protein NETWORKED 4B n=1 Tax=Tarenaya hassleriana TaxID=28532 RepID=UPI00053C76B2|nr:PREDICTED: protein NETWORKED 4B [Tarenaya hassleriana]
MASSTAHHAKGKFRRSATKKSHSWWWNSHISPKNSRWLAENLEKMDDSVNRMLKLIEEDADSFAQKAQMYYQKRPDLIHLVEEFYRMYRALAERYDHVTRELSKNLPPSEPDSEGSLHSLSRRQSGRPELEPEPEPEPGHSPENEGESSSLTDSASNSDSDSESGSVSDDYEVLNRRIAELELELSETKQKLLMQQEVNEDVSAGGFNSDNAVGDQVAMYERELREANEKLQIYEEEISKLKIELQSCNCKSSEILNEGSLDSDREVTEDAASSKVQFFEEELRIAKEKLLHFEEETSCLKNELEISNEKLQSFQYKLESAQREAASYKNKLNAEKREVTKLQERIAMLKTSLQDKDYEIRALKTAVSDAEQKIFPEKAQIKAEMSKLLEERTLLGEQLKELESRGRSMEDDVRRMANEKAEMEKRLTGETEKLNTEMAERKSIIHNLREENNGLRGEIAGMREGVRERERKMEGMGKHLEELHMEQVRLRGRAKELAEEAERTRAAALEMAEQKREAIRQLSVSVDHYKDGYLRLRTGISARGLSHSRAVADGRIVGEGE